MALERVPSRHPRARRVSPHVRPEDDPGDHGHGDDSRHGEGADRQFCECQYAQCQPQPAEPQPTIPPAPTTYTYTSTSAAPIPHHNYKPSYHTIQKALRKPQPVPNLLGDRDTANPTPQIEALGVDYIDESEFLTPADASKHVDKPLLTDTPSYGGCRNRRSKALRRIAEAPAMIRTRAGGHG